MTDVYDSPPLLPLLTTAQRLSLGMLLLVSGTEGNVPPAAVNCLSIASSWTAAGPGSAWMLTASFPAGELP